MDKSTLMILRHTFFLRRDKQGDFSISHYEWSTKMLLACSVKYEKVILICEENSVFPKDDLIDLIKSIQLPNFKLFTLNFKEGGRHDIKLSAILSKEKIKLNPHKNIKYIRYFNINKFISDPYVLVVGHDEHAKAGISLDKELNFQDMQKIRRINSEW